MKPKVTFIAQPEYFHFAYKHDLDEVAKVRKSRLNYCMTVDDLRDLIGSKADFNLFFEGNLSLCRFCGDSVVLE